MQAAESDDDHLVHSAFGPPLTGVQLGASIGVGLVSLLLAGLISLLFGTLVTEHRMSQSGIGLCAASEALIMALTTGLFSAVVPTKRLKLLGVIGSVLLGTIDAATMAAHGNGVMLLRAAAGVPEGILLWITIGMIARTATPERWAAILFTGSTITQVIAAGLLTAFLLPRFGANGGFGLLAAAGVFGVAFSLFLPDEFASLPKGEGEGGAPPPRGWLALAGILMFAAAAAAVGVYLLPLAEQHGLSPNAANATVTLGLAAQIAGGALATLIAGRVRYIAVFFVGAAAFLVSWLVFGLHTPGWMLIAAMVVNGIVILLVPPFFVPMTIEVDASRRTAVQSGAVQLLAAAVGPGLAGVIVGDHNINGVLWLSGGMLLFGLVLSSVLHFTATHDA